MGLLGFGYMQCGSRVIFPAVTVPLLTCCVMHRRPSSRQGSRGLSRSALVEVVLMEMLLLGMLLRSLLMLQMHPTSRVAVPGVLSRKLSTQRPSALAYACQLLGELDGVYASRSGSTRQTCKHH